MEKVTIGLKISPEIKKKLEQLADQENRSLSNWILNAIITYAKEHQNADLKDATPKSQK
jgi:predicted transcriptional regulator